MISYDTLWVTLGRVNKYFLLLFIKSSLVGSKCATRLLQFGVASLTVVGFPSGVCVAAEQCCTDRRKWRYQCVAAEPTSTSVLANVLMNSWPVSEVAANTRFTSQLLLGKASFTCKNYCSYYWGCINYTVNVVSVWNSKFPVLRWPSDTSLYSCVLFNALLSNTKIPESSNSTNSSAVAPRACS